MIRNLTSALSVSLLTLGMALNFSACGGDDGPCPDDMCRISGIVLSADRFELLEDACVFLLDHEDTHISQPSTSDGEFTIQVPKGSPFLLAAGDCDDPLSTGGSYYPTLNMDTWHDDTIEQDYTGWPIHLSVNTSILPNGALAAFEAAFENDPSAEMFLPVDSVYGDHAGFIYYSTFWLAVDELGQGDYILDDYVQNTVEITEDNDLCPEGHVKWVNFFDSPGYFPDTENGPDIYYDAGETAPEIDGYSWRPDADYMDEGGVMISFCKPTLDQDTVTLTALAPGHTLPVPFEVYVRPGMCSLILPVSVNGEDRQTMKQALAAFNLP